MAQYKGGSPKQAPSISQPIFDYSVEFVASGVISASAVENVTTQTTNAVSSAIAKPAPKSDEGVDFDEEALLGELFDSSTIAA